MTRSPGGTRPDAAGPVGERLGELRILPIVVIDDAADAEPLAEALIAGGLPCAEVTLRTDAAESALRTMAARPDLLVGAGTVLRPDQVDRALDAGARFMVSPGFSPAVVERCQALGVPVYPGVATATEIQRALEAGLETVKFFPAEASGGLAALTALSEPYPMMRFVPTGGITARTAPDYLAHPAVHAVGGTWMVSRALIRERRFDEITALTAQAVALR